MDTEKFNLPTFDYRAAAEYLGVSESTLRGWNSRKRLPHYKLGTKKVRFSEAQLQKILQSFEVRV